MIRRPMTLLAAALLAISMLAAPAAAHDDTPLHGHVLIQRPTVELLSADADGVPWDGPYLTAMRRCVDMPVTPLQGHHDNVHRGPGGAGLAVPV